MLNENQHVFFVPCIDVLLRIKYNKSSEKFSVDKLAKWVFNHHFFDRVRRIGCEYWRENKTIKT